MIIRRERYYICLVVTLKWQSFVVGCCIKFADGHEHGAWIFEAKIFILNDNWTIIERIHHAIELDSDSCPAIAIDSTSQFPKCCNDTIIIERLFDAWLACLSVSLSNSGSSFCFCLNFCPHETCRVFFHHCSVSIAFAPNMIFFSLQFWFHWFTGELRVHCWKLSDS